MNKFFPAHTECANKGKLDFIQTLSHACTPITPKNIHIDCRKNHKHPSYEKWMHNALKVHVFVKEESFVSVEDKDIKVLTVAHNTTRASFITVRQNLN